MVLSLKQIASIENQTEPWGHMISGLFPGRHCTQFLSFIQFPPDTQTKLSAADKFSSHVRY